MCCATKTSRASALTSTSTRPPFKRRLTLGDGRVMAREFKAGDAMYSPGETHLGENVGSTPTQVLMVELKPGGTCPAGR